MNPVQQAAALIRHRFITHNKYLLKWRPAPRFNIAFAPEMSYAGNMEKDTAHDRDDAHTSWHPFRKPSSSNLTSMGIFLSTAPEYQLTKEPLRIDVVIIKKRKNVPMKNPGASSWVSSLDRKFIRKSGLIPCGLPRLK
jgi:hypothetical protein